MKDLDSNRRKIGKVIEKIRDLQIDLYLIITAEGCDPVIEWIPGVDTIGASAFLFSKDGGKKAIASVIDAPALEEMGLFDEVIHFQSFYETLALSVRNMGVRRIALNYSETVPYCDGLTMGKYKRFLESVGEYSFETVSSDTFIPGIICEGDR